MAAQLCLGRVIGLECRDRHPTVAAQAGALGWIGAEGQEQSAPLADAYAGIQDRVGIEREADCRLLAPVLMDDDIGTAAPDLTPHAAREDREAQPALIFETVPL